VILYFKGNRISRLAPGPAFDQQWDEQIAAPIERLLTTPPDRVGRDIAFAVYRVTSSWLGARSGVQILPPPPGAPVSPYEMGQHPFVLEVPLHCDADWKVTNARRRREVRKYALLLNVLVRGGVEFEARQPRHAWAVLSLEPTATPFPCGYVQLSYFADIGPVVKLDSLELLTLRGRF